MPTRAPVDRLEPTTARIFFLLDLELGGVTYHVSTDFLDVVDEDGTWLPYSDGLEAPEWEETLAWFADSPGEPTVSLALTLEGIDWADLQARGFDLGSMRATLSRWREGTSYGQREVLLEGPVSEPTYGAEGEALAFSLSTVPLEDRSTWPPVEALVDTTTWPDALTEDLGNVYPWVVGTPGWVDTPADDDASGRIPGSPASLVDYGGQRWIIAGHRVRAASVWWRDLADDTSFWQLVDVVHVDDGRGRTVAVIDLVTILPSGSGPDVWISWSPCAAGSFTAIQRALLVDNETFTIDDGVHDPIVFEFKCTGGFVASGGAVVVVDVTAQNTQTWTQGQMITAINAQNFNIRASRGPGYIVLLENTVPGSAGNTALAETVANADFRRVDMDGGLDDYGGLEDPFHGGMLAGAGAVLEWWFGRAGLDTDAGRFAVARDELDAFGLSFFVDEAVVPWEWVQAHLFPILPLSVGVGPSGLFPIVWHAEPREAAERFVVEDLDAERTGPVEFSDLADVANVVSLRYALDGQADAQTRTASIDGTAEGSSRVARSSALRFGARTRTDDTDVVYAADTAGRIVAWQAVAYGLPSRRVTYAVERSRALHLELGQVVALTDQDLHENGTLWHVVGLRDQDDDVLEITLRSV